jgi:hypothetical protein
MEVARNFGFEFTVISVGAPSEAQLEAVRACGRGVATWEIALPEATMASDLRALGQYRHRLECQVFISPIRSAHAGDVDNGKKYFHRISHGFFPAEAERVRDLAPLFKKYGVSGAIFQVGRGEDVVEALAACGNSARSFGIPYALYLRARDNNPAMAGMALEETTRRAVDWTLAAGTRGCAYVAFDTFVDVERGFCMRPGLVDRLYNPKPGARAVRELNRVLINVDHVELLPAVSTLGTWARPFLVDGVRHLAIVCTDERERSIRRIALPEAWSGQHAELISSGGNCGAVSLGGGGESRELELSRFQGGDMALIRVH